MLGIGDAPYDGLDQRLRQALSEYYLVADMENYDLVLRAIGHFIHKWGRIDRFESLNEHWLDLEAGIRTDFNIFGTKLDFVKNLKRKSRMRAFFRKSGVETIPQRTCSDRAGALTFIRRVGYPVVVKPDQRLGRVSNTYKISTMQAELDAFLPLTSPKGVTFVMEQFIEGLVVTYDGLVNIDGEVVFAASTRYDQSVMEVVNKDRHMSYVCRPEVDPAIEEAGPQDPQGVRRARALLPHRVVPDRRRARHRAGGQHAAARRLDDRRDQLHLRHRHLCRMGEHGGQEQGRRAVQGQILHRLCQPKTPHPLSP